MERGRTHYEVKIEGGLMSLLDTIKRTTIDAFNATNPVNILYGKVSKVSPLEIQVHQKMTLTKEFLVLSRNVTDHEIEMTVDHTTESSLSTVDFSHNHEYNGDTEEGGEEPHHHAYSGTTSNGGGSKDLSHSHAYKGRKKFVVHNALKTGEKVILLRVQGGHQFVVIDRVVK